MGMNQDRTPISKVDQPPSAPPRRSPPAPDPQRTHTDKDRMNMAMLQVAGISEAMITCHRG
jgi:hypothetical protein